MKKTFAILIALTLALAVPALAASFADMPAAPAAQEFFAAYEGNGIVEIDFRSDVRYRDLTVTVRDPLDPLAAPLTAVILETDDDDLTFRIDGAKDETTYAFTLSGVKTRGSEDFRTLTGEITTPAAGHTLIQQIEWDDGELEVELLGPVAYDNLTVTLTDAQGADVPVTVGERDNDGLELHVRRLNSGEEYTLTLSGVGLRGSGVSANVTRTFIAR